MQLFTTAEAAAYLRLKERKIYEMVAEGSVPCTKVTGRWLFPKAELDQWLTARLVRPDGVARPQPVAHRVSGAPGGRPPSAADPDRRRQSRSAAGMGAARKRLRPRHARGRQRGGP